MKKEIQFTTRVITLVRTDVILNDDYDEPFPEMVFEFDFPSANLSFSLMKTRLVESEWETVKNIFDILGLTKASEMSFEKLLELRIAIDGNEPEICGLGDYSSDRFIDIWGDGSVMTKKELEECVKERLK